MEVKKNKLQLDNLSRGKVNEYSQCQLVFPSTVEKKEIRWRRGKIEEKDEFKNAEKRRK